MSIIKKLNYFWPDPFLPFLKNVLRPPGSNLTLLYAEVSSSLVKNSKLQA